MQGKLLQLAPSGWPAAAAADPTHAHRKRRRGHQVLLEQAPPRQSCLFQQALSALGAS